MEEEQGKVPPPSALAIGICDLIYRDRATGKRFILGCFGAINSAEFPTVHPALGVYLDLTNGRGRVSLKVRIIDCDEEREPVWTIEQDIEFEDPRMIFELDYLIGGLNFPEPGEYRVQAFANGEFLIERRLIVNKIGDGP